MLNLMDSERYQVQVTDHVSQSAFWQKQKATQDLNHRITGHGHAHHSAICVTLETPDRPPILACAAKLERQAEVSS